jgi:hypothetical protein
MVRLHYRYLVSNSIPHGRYQPTEAQQITHNFLLCETNQLIEHNNLFNSINCCLLIQILLYNLMLTS